MKNIDIGEWLLNNNIDPDTEIITDDKQWFLHDILEKHLKEQFATHSVVFRETELCEGLCSTDFNGKCFKCGQQVWVRELNTTKNMTIQELIKKYKDKLSKIDESLAKITKLFRKGKDGDINIDMDLLMEKEIIGNSCRQIYIDIIEDLESIQHLKTNL